MSYPIDIISLTLFPLIFAGPRVHPDADEDDPGVAAGGQPPAVHAAALQPAAGVGAAPDGAGRGGQEAEGDGAQKQRKGRYDSTLL